MLNGDHGMTRVNRSIFVTSLAALLAVASLSGQPRPARAVQVGLCTPAQEHPRRQRRRASTISSSARRNSPRWPTPTSRKPPPTSRRSGWRCRRQTLPAGDAEGHRSRRSIASSRCARPQRRSRACRGSGRRSSCSAAAARAACPTAYRKTTRSSSSSSSAAAPRRKPRPRGITIAVEPLRQRGDQHHQLGGRGARSWWKRSTIRTSELMIDFYHLASEHEDPAIVLKASEHIRHLHMANPQGRVYPAEWEEFDYGPFFANLKQDRLRQAHQHRGDRQGFPARSAESDRAPAPRISELVIPPARPPADRSAMRASRGRGTPGLQSA